MSHTSQSLSQKIKLIEKHANPKNMEIIYNELKSLSEKESKLEENINEVCKLINLIGTFLVKGESTNTTESQLIFDTFCDKDFMKLLVKYSTFDNYQINLEIIKTFSFLMINIKNTTYLYYFFSKNLLNGIINKDYYSKYDEEFLSYYINFLKSLSLRLDEFSVQLFYDEKKNSFPIMENVIRLYNHRDSMIRNVVRNIVLNILKIKSANIQDHFIELPSVSYLANLACHLRDICLKMNNDIEKRKINNLQYLYDDLIDEASYIDDLLNLNLNKINYIIINCVFYYLIIPVICGALSEKTNKISKKLALFLIVFFFINMKNEVFKNCLFSLIFFDKLSQDLDYLFTYPQEKANYSFYPDYKKDISFFEFVSENFSSKFLLTIIQKDNIIYNKYKDKYPQLADILLKCEGFYEMINSKNDVSVIETKEKIEMVLVSLFNEDESNNMSQYHLNLSMSTGLGVGQYSKENTGEIYSLCFLCYMNPIFVELKGNEKENSNYLNYKKNIIKEGLYKLMEEANGKDESILLLINLLFFVVIHNDVNICPNLLKHTGLENIREKITIKQSLMQDFFDNVSNKKKENNNSPLSELCFNNNNFNYNNKYFNTTKDPKNKIFNDTALILNLSNLLLIKHIDKNNNEENMNKFLLPFIYKLIIFNIINLSFNKNNSFQLEKESNNYIMIINNVENIYNQIVQSINSLIKKVEKYRDIGYNVFYQQWKIYNEKINDKNILELIKDEVMNTNYILLPEEYEKNSEEKYFSEISRKDLNTQNKIFEYKLLLFMMIHDLREMLLINNDVKNLNSLNLIKDAFPLNNKNNESELNIDCEYELQKIKSMKNFCMFSISYEFDESKKFEEGELIILNKFTYFVEKIEENKIKIKHKYKINNIYPFQDNNNSQEGNNLINFLICENFTLKKENQEEEKKLNILVKFKDDQTKDELSKFINDKSFSLNNDERLAFFGYFEEINNKIKNFEEDF